MNTLNIDDIKKGLVDLSARNINYDNGEFYPSDELVVEVAELAEKTNKYAAVYGVGKLFSDHGLALRDHKDKAYALYDRLYKSVMDKVDMSKYSVTERESSLGLFDVDGYKVNGGFSHDGKVEERKFVTTKCIHFDTATPFIANIYGPNDNIEGGYPIITETHRYLKDHQIKPQDLVINIPQNYNIAVRAEHYEKLLESYSFSLNIDLSNDMLMMVLLNEIQFGVAHAATDPIKSDENLDCSRPIRHYEYQYLEEAHYDEWLDYYQLDLSEVSDYDGSVDLSLNRYELAAQAIDSVTEIAVRQA